MKRIFFFLAIIGLIFTNLGFQKKETSPEVSFQERLNQELANKINKLKQKKEQECLEKLLERANQIVDSTLIADARKLKTTPVDKPARPVKPEKPELLPAKDSTALGPLFDKKLPE